MVHRQPPVDRVHGMGDGMDDPSAAQIRRQIENAGPPAADLFMIRLGNAVSQDMELALVLREIGGDLLADEGSVQVGDLQAGLDGVVVGDRDQIHAVSFQRGVEMAGIGVAPRRRGVGNVLNGRGDRLG